MDNKIKMPVYKLLADKLCDRIAALNLEDGDFFTTIKDISSQYNVAVLTARRAVEVLQKNGIIICKAACGIFVKSTAALAAVRARKNFILIIDDHSDGSRMVSYWAMRLCSILEVFSNAGFSVKISNSNEISENDLFYMKELLSGIVISSSRANKYINFFNDKSAPPTAFTRRPPDDCKGEKYSFPLYDDSELIRMGYDYFLRNGKKKVIIIDFANSYLPKEYKNICKNLNISEIKYDFTPSVEAGKLIGESLNIDNETGLWVQDDFTALGIYNYFLGRGRDLFAEKALLASAGPTVGITEQIGLPVIGYCPRESGKAIATGLINIILEQKTFPLIISPKANKNIICPY